MSDQEIWLPLKRFGKVIPDYSISDQGRVRRISTNEILTPNTTGQPWKNWAGLCVSIRIPSTDFFGEEYKYSSRSITVRVHRLVMEAFRPIDEYPPIPENDWNATPETAKQFIRESVLIDHINNDPLDNRLENLRWISALQNSSVRKKAKMVKDGIQLPEKRGVKIEESTTPTLESLFV